jgi:hypothetical protein
VAAVALAACSSEPDCSAVGTALDRLTPAGTVRDHRATRTRAVFTTRCTADQWPAKALRCIANATTRDELTRCTLKNLTRPQADRLTTDLAEVLVGPEGARKLEDQLRQGVRDEAREAVDQVLEQQLGSGSAR